MLGENIRALRKARGLSQQELAERLHVVRQTVSKWEQGLSVPDADMLVRLAECLEVSVEELLGAPKPESTAPLEPQAVLADKLSSLTGQLAEQNHRRRRFWKWVAIAAGICGLLLLQQLVLTLLMLGYGLPANSSIGIIGGWPYRHFCHRRLSVGAHLRYSGLHRPGDIGRHHEPPPGLRRNL